jgi:DNA-directed RNA polymerase III subunit RPC8
MFMLSLIEEHIRVEPAQLGLSTASAVEQQIKTLFFDKVIPNVGLVVSLYDIQSLSGGDVHIGDGGAHFVAQFRLVVFRPYEGEVLLGNVHVSSACAFHHSFCGVMHIVNSWAVEAPQYSRVLHVQQAVYCIVGPVPGSVRR